MNVPRTRRAAVENIAKAIETVWKCCGTRVRRGTRVLILACGIALVPNCDVTVNIHAQECTASSPVGENSDSLPAKPLSPKASRSGKNSRRVQ